MTDASHPGHDLAQLKAARPDEVALGAPLSTICRWRIGGPADAIVTPRSARSLAGTIAFLKARGVRYVIVGDGSNILFDDAGFRGAVIRIGRAFGGFEDRGGGHIRAGAGLWVPTFARRVIGLGLAGAVHTIGIPGTLGGLVVMNGGSQRKGIGSHVEAVEVLAADGAIARIEGAALGFAYRCSALQDNGATVLSIDFRFEPGDAGALRREAISILAARRAKFPKVRANCGSVFVSDPALYASIGPPGMAIERVGLMGRSCGDAQISPDHANFIVNNGRARSADVLTLIAEARQRVEAATGVAMEAEVRHLDPYGRLRPAHEVAPPQEKQDDGQRAHFA